jgi:hypothetical protein
MMEWIVPILALTLAGALGWILYLLSQLEQRDGWIQRTQAEIFFIRKACPLEWMEIEKALHKHNKEPL